MVLAKVYQLKMLTSE